MLERLQIFCIYFKTFASMGFFQDFFREANLLLCRFLCHAKFSMVFRQNFWGGSKLSQGGALPATLWKKASFSSLRFVFCFALFIEETLICSHHNSQKVASTTVKTVCGETQVWICGSSEGGYASRACP